jgi:predicted ATP-grasp superfamily ATP-dependent carboligase
MKIFICEYITGGGLYRAPLPASLVSEGALMRDALLRDLSDIPGLSLSVTYDVRLTRSDLDIHAIAIHPEEDIDLVWDAAIREADAVWIIAPETDGVLSRLSARVLAHGRKLIGCAPAIVDLMADKYQTYQALTTAGVLAIPTYRRATWPSSREGAWVVKPDDGVGCEDVRYLPTTASLQAWLSQQQDEHWIIQPYVEGVAASLSMLCHAGQGWLLSCNRQRVAIENGDFRFSGCAVNALSDQWNVLEPLAKKLAAAIPGLSGYIGVDVVMAENGPQVVEINPRLTTSYAGLRASIGCNPARLVLDLLYNEIFDGTGFNMPEHLSRQVIEVTP